MNQSNIDDIFEEQKGSENEESDYEDEDNMYKNFGPSSTLTPKKPY